MKTKELIKVFSKDKTFFVKGAGVLKKEAKENGYKLTVTGLQTFLDNCDMEQDERQFYELCIPYAII